MSTQTTLQRVIDRAKSEVRAAHERRIQPEDSLQLRLVALATVMVAVVALLAQGVVDTATALGTLVLVPVGFVFSHYRRRERNILLKLLLAVLLFVALGSFLGAVRYATSVDQARTALASLFLWVQVIHSFDLPRLRDLSFSIIASVVVMAEAGALSLSTGFGLFLIPFAILCGVWLFLSYRSQAERDAGQTTIRRVQVQPGTDPGRRLPLRTLATTSALALVAGGAVFISVPRLPGAAVIAPPFSLIRTTAVPGFSGQVVNPGARTTAAGVSVFAPDAYPGFGSSVDLRARGALGDDIVMKVRAPQAAFWRGQAYDTFDGTTWTASRTGTNDIWGSLAFDIPDLGAKEQTWVPSPRLLQTFYVQKEQPNIAFAAYQPMQLYFPASKASVDEYLSIRTPIMLDPGLVYSVVSEVPDATPALLRRANRELPPGMGNYLQLPPELPQRVVDLAHQITDGQPTAYDKVMAVQNWLKANATYNLNIPPDPPGVDAVDYFLFVRRQGYCEHFSSAMAVLLRAVGIPTRLAVGFGSGERNPFTGYFEVRESDAHSWAEVYYPRVGWIEYDPTHAVPPAEVGPGANFIAPEVIAAIGRFFIRVTPEPIKHALQSSGRAIAATARASLAVWPLIPIVVVPATVLTLFLRAVRRKRRRGPAPTGAAAAFAALCEIFAARGHRREPQFTPSEHLKRLLTTDELARESRDDLRRIVGAFERDRFANTKPDAAEVTTAMAAAARLRERARTVR